MLFLMNDSVIDIGDPEMSLIDAVGVIGLRHDRLSARDVVEMGRQVWFKARGEPSAAVQRAIAALIAMKLEADAALFIVPPDARGPADVKTRFASASTTLIAQMYARQNIGALTPREINEAIWAQASSQAASYQAAARHGGYLGPEFRAGAYGR